MWKYTPEEFLAKLEKIKMKYKFKMDLSDVMVKIMKLYVRSQI